MSERTHDESKTVFHSDGWGKLIVTGLAGLMLFTVVAIGILPNLEEKLERRDRERYLSGFIDGLAAAGFGEGTKFQDYIETSKNLRGLLEDIEERKEGKK